MFTECTDDQAQMGEKREELKRLKALLAQKEKENDLLREKMQTGLAPYPLTPETINNSSVPNSFGYFTVFSVMMSLTNSADFSDYQIVKQSHKHTFP